MPRKRMPRGEDARKGREREIMCVTLLHFIKDILMFTRLRVLEGFSLLTRRRK